MLLNLLSAEWFLFRFDSPMNACRTIAIWLSAVLVIVFALIMLLTSGGTRKKCAKISLIVTIVYVAALSVLFGETQPPVILDDALLQLDDSRLKAAADFLINSGGFDQVIYFTCHKTSAKLFQNESIHRMEL